MVFFVVRRKGPGFLMRRRSVMGKAHPNNNDRTFFIFKK